jgi:hypothetical protein
MSKSPTKLLAGAEACRAMLASIEALSNLSIKPASASDADAKAAYAGQYADVDKAVSMALDQHGDSAGFRVALGSYLLTVAGGSTIDLEKTTADGLLTDGGFRAMPEEPADYADDTDPGDRDRRSVAIEAVAEIESIARHLQELNQDSTDAERVMRGLFLRLEALSGVAYTFVGEEGATTDEMRATVYGERIAAKEVAKHG